MPFYNNFCRTGIPSRPGSYLSQPCVHRYDQHLCPGWTCRLPHRLGSDSCSALSPHVRHQRHFRNDRCRWTAAHGRWTCSTNSCPAAVCGCCLCQLHQHLWWFPCYEAHVGHVQEVRQRDFPYFVVEIWLNRTFLDSTMN